MGLGRRRRSGTRRETKSREFGRSDGGARHGRGAREPEYAPVPFLSPAVQRGFGFFETVLLAGRRAVLWEPHLDRLLPDPRAPRPARALARGVSTPPRSAPSTRRAAKPAEQRAPAPHVDRRRATTSTTPASWRLDAYVLPIPESRLARRTARTRVSLPLDLQRDTPGVKSTSYFAAIQGGRLAKKAGADEGLFRAPDGRYLEGTTTGLAAWNGGTPVLAPEGVLPSVTAAAFLDGQAASAPLTARSTSARGDPPRLADDGGAAPLARRERRARAPRDARADPRPSTERLLSDPALGTVL